MYKEKRYEFILKHLENEEYIAADTIAEKFSVTPMTVRRDLSFLEEQGLLVRNHGGAIRTTATDAAVSFSRKAKKNKKRKIDLCRIAASYINENETIFVDCGSTLYYLGGFIRNKKNLRVVTNSLPLLQELINYTDIKVHFIGGEVNGKRKATYGMFTEKYIREIFADKSFIGADGVSLENGISSFDAQEGAITSAMIAQSREVYLLCDSSKLDNNSYCHVAGLEKVHCMITNGDDHIERAERYKKVKTLKVVTA